MQMGTSSLNLSSAIRSGSFIWLVNSKKQIFISAYCMHSSELRTVYIMFGSVLVVVQQPFFVIPVPSVISLAIMNGEKFISSAMSTMDFPPL